MTKIEWCRNPDGTKGESWNPIKMRCTPVSEGCQNCYSKRILSRNLPGMNYPAKGEPPRLDFQAWSQPLHWRKPRRVFVMSMGDLFHEDVDWNSQFKVFQMMVLNPKHTFIILTKRPQIMLRQMADIWFHMGRNALGRGPLPLPNVWLGVTAENQRTADERIPILLKIPAAVRFVSVEPMLGPVDLCHVQTDMVEINTLTGDHGVYRPHQGKSDNHLNWIICGGETGPGARWMNALWATDLRDQCKDAGVPFFFKQWGGKWREEGILMPREWPEGD